MQVKDMAFIDFLRYNGWSLYFAIEMEDLVYEEEKTPWPQVLQEALPPDSRSDA